MRGEPIATLAAPGSQKRSCERWKLAIALEDAAAAKSAKLAIEKSPKRWPAAGLSRS
jgi:hypothetical protein